MNACPTSAPMTINRSQYDRDAASSRSSFSMSQRHVLGADASAPGPWASGKGKKNLFESARCQIRLGSQFIERPFADDFAAAQQHETVTDAAGVAELVDREKQGAPGRRGVLQDGHNVSRLTEVESVERLVQHQERLRGQ